MYDPTPRTFNDEYYGIVDAVIDVLLPLWVLLFILAEVFSAFTGGIVINSFLELWKLVIVNAVTIVIIFLIVFALAHLIMYAYRAYDVKFNDGMYAKQRIAKRDREDEDWWNNVC